MLNLFKIKQSKGKTRYFFHTEDDHPVVSTSSSLHSQKWKIGVSVSCGCKADCIFCYARNFPDYYALSESEILEQVDTIVQHEALTNQIIHVEYNQMGDCFFNLDTCVRSMQAILSKYPVASFVIHTSCPEPPPQTSHLWALDALKTLITHQKNIFLRVSCVSTNEVHRKKLHPNTEMLSLSHIMKLIHALYADQPYKVVLSFLPLQGIEIDVEKLRQMISPELVSVRFVPIRILPHMAQLGFQRLSDMQMQHLKTEFSNYGYEVV